MSFDNSVTGVFTAAGTQMIPLAQTMPGYTTYAIPNIQYQYEMPSGTEVKISMTVDIKKEISAALYVKFVKSKVGKVQLEKVRHRLGKLQKLVAYATEMGQQALYEELTKEVAVLVREAEMVAYGVDKFVDLNDIKKFMDIVKGKVIKFEKLEKFPRVIPANVQKKVKALTEAKIFDDLWILFIDYTKQDIKTNKEKIRDKDPILFGQFSHQAQKYYYIADWVDEYCDLTLDKFVSEIKTKDPKFALSEVPNISPERWAGIVKEVKERNERLAGTKPSNFRDKMAEEEFLKKEQALKESEAALKAKVAQLELELKGPAVKESRWKGVLKWLPKKRST